MYMKMMTGRCEDQEGKELKLMRGECNNTRGLPLEDESDVIYTGPQQTQCMRSKDKSTCCIDNSDKACISTELSDLI